MLHYNARRSTGACMGQIDIKNCAAERSTSITLIVGWCTSLVRNFEQEFLIKSARFTNLKIETIEGTRGVY